MPGLRALLVTTTAPVLAHRWVMREQASRQNRRVHLLLTVAGRSRPSHSPGALNSPGGPDPAGATGGGNPVA